MFLSMEDAAVAFLSGRIDECSRARPNISDLYLLPCDVSSAYRVKVAELYF